MLELRRRDGAARDVRWTSRLVQKSTDAGAYRLQRSTEPEQNSAALELACLLVSYSAAHAHSEISSTLSFACVRRYDNTDPSPLLFNTKKYIYTF